MPKGSTLQMKHLMASSFFQRLGKTFLKILGVPGEVAHAWWRPAGSNSWGCNVIDPPYTTIYSRCLVRCRVLQVLSVSGQSCLCGQDLQRWIEIYGFWNWECLFLSSHQSFHIIFHLYYSSLDSWIKTTSHTHTHTPIFPDFLPPKKVGGFSKNHWFLVDDFRYGQDSSTSEHHDYMKACNYEDHWIENREGKLKWVQLFWEVISFCFWKKQRDIGSMIVMVIASKWMNFPHKKIISWFRLAFHEFLYGSSAPFLPMHCLKKRFPGCLYVQGVLSGDLRDQSHGWIR